MTINELERYDSVMATVQRISNKDGDNNAYLTIDELTDAYPIVMLHNYAGYVGEKVLVTIKRISPDKGYIKVFLDSFISSDNYFAA